MERMLEEYAEGAGGRSLEYAYGYFDAVGVVRDMQGFGEKCMIMVNYSGKSGEAQGEGMKNRGLLEKEILRLARRAEDRVLETVYYILVG